MWKPIAESEMIVLVDEEIAKLDELTRPTWKKYKVKLQQIPVEHEGSDRNSVYILARAEREVLLFDDVAERFATGLIDPDGVLRKWSLHSERLAPTLRHFPSNRRPAS